MSSYTVHKKNGQVFRVHSSPPVSDTNRSGQIVHSGFLSVLATHKLLTIMCSDTEPSVPKTAGSFGSDHVSWWSICLCFRCKKTYRDLHVDTFGRFALGNIEVVVEIYRIAVMEAKDKIIFQFGVDDCHFMFLRLYGIPGGPKRHLNFIKY